MPVPSTKPAPASVAVPGRAVTARRGTRPRPCRRRREHTRRSPRTPERMASSAGVGSLSTMKARPMRVIRLVRECVTEEAAVRQRSVVLRTDEQVATSVRAVGAGQADICQPPEPHVVDGAQDAGRRAEGRDVDDLRPVREVEEAPEVDRVAVRREEQRCRVHLVGIEHERHCPRRRWLRSRAGSPPARLLPGVSTHASTARAKSRWS